MPSVWHPSIQGLPKRRIVKSRRARPLPAAARQCDSKATPARRRGLELSTSACVEYGRGVLRADEAIQVGSLVALVRWRRARRPLRDAPTLRCPIATVKPARRPRLPHLILIEARRARAIVLVKVWMIRGRSRLGSRARGLSARWRSNPPLARTHKMWTPMQVSRVLETRERHAEALARTFATPIGDPNRPAVLAEFAEASDGRDDAMNPF